MNTKEVQELLVNTCYAWFLCTLASVDMSHGKHISQPSHFMCTQFNLSAALNKNTTCTHLINRIMSDVHYVYQCTKYFQGQQQITLCLTNTGIPRHLTDQNGVCIGVAKWTRCIIKKIK